MATVAELMVRIAADSQPLRKELNATKKQIRDAFGSDFLEVSNMAKTALAGIGAGIAAIGVASVKQAANLERVTTAFTNMLGSAEKSSAFIKDLQNFAAKTPFEFTQVTAAAQKFLAFGFTAEQIIPTLTAVGNAAAGVGLSAEGIDRVTLALGQMAAKSKVQSDEMLQLTETGIPAWQILADKIGTSVPDAMDKVSKGAIDAQTGILALVEGMQNKFGGMMEMQSQTIAGSWSNMMDGIDQSMAQIGVKIADALNLTEIFQSAGTTLSNFAGLVQTSGIAEAFQQAIPTELQVGLVALATTLVGIAIPAISMGATALIGFAAPLLTAIGVFAPYIAGLASIAAGMYYLYQQGVSVNDVLQYLGVNTDNLTSLFSNFQTMVSNVGSAISVTLNALQPVFTALLTVVTAVLTGAGQLFGLWVNTVVGAVNAIVTALNYVAQGWEWLFTEVSGILSSLSDILDDMVSSVLPSWVSSGIDSISEFVGTAVGLLDSLISKITDTNKALNSVGESKKAFNGDSEKTTTKPEKTELPDYSQFKTAGTGGTSSGGSKGGSGQDLAAAASQTSKHIEDEWFRTFQSQSAMVDKWYQEESAALEKSAAMNANYQRDKDRLNELYSQKRLEALAAEAQKEQDIREQVRQMGADSAGLQMEAYGSSTQQQLQQMQSDYDSAIAGIENKYAQFTNNFMTMTEQQKQAFLAACDAQGIAYEIMENGMISFAEQANADKLAKEAIYQQQRVEYFKNAEDLKGELQDAYNAMEIERFMALLTEENAMRLADLEATQSLMQTYQEAYMAAHATNLELIAEMSNTALGGLSDAFTGILTGAKSAKQAFSDLGKSMIKTIAQFFAQQVAGMIMTSVLGDTIRNQANAKIAADAAAANAVWAPAAWSKLVVDPSSAGVATGLLTEGLASAGTIAAATQSILGNSGQGGVTGSGSFGSYNNSSFNDLGGYKIPQYAKGGLFKSASIGIIGEGVSDEVALPLNEAVFSNLAAGIVEAGGNAQGNTEVNAALNIYGDVNTGADQDELYEDFGSMLMSAIRGRK